MTTAVVEPQPLRALRDANVVRSQRSQTKAWIAQARPDSESRSRCAEVLMDPPGHIESMAIVDLLRQVHQYGPVDVARLCALAGIRDNREVGSLSLRQRALISSEMRGLRERDLEGLVA